jgi:hypothetical protein
MNMLRTYALQILLAATAVVGCSNGDDPVGGSGTGTISGKVVDVMGLPIAGATIVSVPSTQTVTSGADGSFSLGNVAAGSYSIGVVKSGYQSDTQTLSVSGGNTSTLTSRLPEEGLIAAYSFNGSVEDVSGRGHNGTNVGATPATNRFGEASSAMAFGGNAFISIPHAIDLNFGSSTSFTATAWVRFSSSQPDYAGILSKMVGGLRAPFSGFQIFVINSSTAGAQVETIESRNDINGRSSIGDDRWHMMTLVVSRPQATAWLYVDAVVENEHPSSTLQADLANTDPMIIGKDRTSARFFNGEIDDIRLFNRALSQAEVQALYNR